MKPPVSVAIDARIVAGGVSGGIEQFITGLLWGLGRLDDGPERYFVVAGVDNTDWLVPHLGENQELVVVPPAPAGRVESAKRRLGPFRKPLANANRAVRRAIARIVPPASADIPRSCGLYESLGASLVHFPHQCYVRTGLPTVYNPHDLQHRHFPEFFATGEIARREAVYRTACRLSRAVVAESHFTRRDLVAQFHLPAGRTLVVPRGVPIQLAPPPSDSDLRELASRFSLPDRFALFPAQVWPHKNHKVLLEALALLRARLGITLSVICTGTTNEHLDQIVSRARDLGLERQCRFVGYVASADLRGLYRLATLLVFPSLFEGGGFPIVEAFSEGLPVACSRTSALAETAGDAALLFDPTSPDDIAAALGRLLRDDALRTTLIDRGHLRAARLDWTVTARTYRALYREITGLELGAEDRDLLASARSESVP